MADIGKEVKEVEFAPLPEVAPVETPAPAPVEAPSEPVPA